MDAEVWYMSKEKREMGMSVTGIAKEMGVSRSTVRKYMNARKPLAYSKKKRTYKLDPYRDYIKARIDKYNLSAVRIFDEKRRRGTMADIQH